MQYLTFTVHRNRGPALAVDSYCADFLQRNSLLPNPLNGSTHCFPPVIRVLLRPSRLGVKHFIFLAALGCDLAIIDKRRPKANVAEVMHVIGEIEGRNCVIMDDMIDTAGTLVKAAEVLKDRGARSVYAYCTHPILSGPAVERIAEQAAQAGCLIWAPRDEPYPVGYYCGLRDPAGNYVEFSYGQPLGPGSEAMPIP